MGLNDIKISVKLIVGFAIITAILVTVGLVGYNGLMTAEHDLEGIHVDLEEIVHDVGMMSVWYTSVEELMIMSEAQTAIAEGEHELLNVYAGREGVAAAKTRISNAFARADHAWAIYEPLEQTEEEAKVWNRFVPVWKWLLE